MAWLSIAYADRGWAATVGQVCGSRGVPRVNTWSKVRAEASRWVNGTPRSQALRSVAISEVCRYSSLYTEPRLDPWRHDDDGDAVAGTVEREAEVTRRCGRIGRRDRSRLLRAHSCVTLGGLAA